MIRGGLWWLVGGLVITGSYHRSLDAKKRFAVPKRWRETLVDSDEVYVAPGPDQCLHIHSRQSLDLFASRLSELERLDQPTRNFKRLFYGRAESCPMDVQGRVRIPLRLTEWAQLGSDLVLVGVGSFVEIWDQFRWESFLQAHRNDYDRMLEQALASESGHLQPGRPAIDEAHKPVPR